MKQTNSSLLHARIVFLSRLCLQHERRDAIVWNKYENLLQKHPDERGCGHIVSWDMPSTVEIFINVTLERTDVRSLYWVLKRTKAPTDNMQWSLRATGGRHHHLSDNTCPQTQPQRGPEGLGFSFSFFFSFFFCFVFIESSEFNLWLHTPAPQKIHAKKRLLKYWYRFLCSLQTSRGCFTYLLAAWVFYGYRADLKS